MMPSCLSSDATKGPVVACHDFGYFRCGLWISDWISGFTIGSQNFGINL